MRLNFLALPADERRLYIKGQKTVPRNRQGFLRGGCGR